MEILLKKNSDFELLVPDHKVSQDSNKGLLDFKAYRRDFITVHHTGFSFSRHISRLHFPVSIAVVVIL